MEYTIRPFRRGDAPALIDLRLVAIHQVGRTAYSQDQVAAWAARVGTAADLLGRVQAGDHIVVATTEEDRPVAYALLQPDGHLDHLYANPGHTRRGLADRLLEGSEELARELHLARLFTEASDLARPAFERAGYVLIERRDFEIDGVAIHNYAMEKTLP